MDKLSDLRAKMAALDAQAKIGAMAETEQAQEEGAGPTLNAAKQATKWWLPHVIWFGPTVCAVWPREDE